MGAGGLSPLTLTTDAHSADLLCDLHWLPVRKRVMFKAASLCYRSCTFGQPAYLPLASYIPARHLRSSNSDRLNEPPARIAIGERRFSHYALRTWNSLPTTVTIRWQLRLLQGPAKDSSVWHCLTLKNVALRIRAHDSEFLHCALASCGAVYCNRSCLWACLQWAGGRVGGRAVSEPYYSQHARSVCVSLSAFSLFIKKGTLKFY